MRYVCVHGHFYQPPRESPSLEAVELQDSAYPYHDWNERVTAECYIPNATSRLLDEQQRITKLVNNYAQMSFDFGPTLLLWMEHESPEILESIREADRQSQEHFGGHGSAMAQAYNHMIQPLAHPRDKETQVIWGVRDFIHHFGRQPEGMWLPETAVDIASLEALAAQGIQFTVLSPRQAKRVRRRGSRTWVDVSGERIDPSRAYEVRLPSRKSIAVFFYDGPISQAVAFEGLLNNGRHFADRLLSGFSDQRTWPQLSHIATDGETYGHHHAFGEMALTYALHCIETSGTAQLTNYGQFLEMFPPDHFVDIVDNTSWSCIHGIERWRSNCGCNSGGYPHWNQEWRAPLRNALDWLREELAQVLEREGKAMLRDPWAARNGYIDVVLNRSEQSLDAFWQKHAARSLDHEEKVRALKLLEMQRHAMLMYTSCGWFFDELSGLETVQVLHYAGRALQLAREATGAPAELEQQFCERLREAKSNIPEHGDGEAIYKKWVAPAIVTPDKVMAHYAVSSLFETNGERNRIYCYSVERQDYSVETEGRVRMAIGRARVRSGVTTEESLLSFAVLHLGDHNIAGGVREFESDDRFRELRDKLNEAFTRADTAEAIRILDEQFNKKIFSLHSIFRDEQRRIINTILKETLNTVSGSLRTMYESQAPLLRFLNALSVPVPDAFLSVASIALNSQLRQALERPEIDAAAVRGLLHEAELNRIQLDQATLEYTIRKRIEDQAALFRQNPDHFDALKRLHSLLDVATELPFPVTLWAAQNLCFQQLAQNGASHNGDGKPKPGQTPEPDWGPELIAVRERLHIHGPQ
jgi:alpha-amylase/alpha-mannosidase (GH57 family)